MSGQSGYIYRQTNITEAALRELVRQVVFAGDAGRVIAFAANTVDICPVTIYTAAEEIPLQGARGPLTFGHIFSAQTEVRWKRQGQRVDLLLLLEQEQPTTIPVEAEALTPPCGLEARPQAETVSTLFGAPAAIQPLLGTIDYRRRDNHVVQFVRYTTRRKEASR